MSTAGLLLAAGAAPDGHAQGAARDHRRGALRPTARVGRLLDGGCESVTVVLGSPPTTPPPLDEAGWCDDDAVDVVVADDWAEGMGASLRAGLRRWSGGPTRSPRPSSRWSTCPTSTPPSCAGSSTVRATRATSSPGRRTTARRPPGAARSRPLGGRRGPATGDRGARDYLRDRDVRLVECGDLATGRDVDTPDLTLRPSPRAPTASTTVVLGA